MYIAQLINYAAAHKFKQLNNEERDLLLRLRSYSENNYNKYSHIQNAMRFCNKIYVVLPSRIYNEFILNKPKIEKLVAKTSVPPLWEIPDLVPANVFLARLIIQVITLIIFIMTIGFIKIWATVAAITFMIYLIRWNENSNIHSMFNAITMPEFYYLALLKGYNL